MEPSLLLAILPGILMPFLIVGFVFGVIIFIQKKTFQALKEEFNKAELPSKAIKLGFLKYGNSIFRNLTKLAEEGSDLILKLPMQDPIRIPYTSFSNLTTKENQWKQIQASAEFKNKNLNL